MKTNTISALLRAVEQNKGYEIKVPLLSKSKNLVFIKLDNPLRTCVMTKEAFSKISDYIKEEKK